MYDELILELRKDAEFLKLSARYNDTKNEFAERILQAVNAIEKLSKPNDVQPVVRCIKCKYYEGLACCKLIGDCGGTNWFCGWGEPKEET